LEFAILGIAIIILAISIAGLLKTLKEPSIRAIEESVRKSLGDIQSLILQENSMMREEFDQKLGRTRDSLTAMLIDLREAQQKSFGEQSIRIAENLEQLRARTDERLSQTSESQNRRLSELMTSSAGNMEGIRNKVDERLDKIQSELEKELGALLRSNEKKLEEMRLTVNEKLEKTLETRLQKSFETVSTQLESVNKGLGEMRTVAESVGSLNKVLAGAKTRGILGELQLGKIIEDMLPSQLYEVEVPTISGSKERVEYAIKFPGSQEGKHIYLPIDSKFPLEDYYRLLEGYETGDTALIESSRKALLDRVKWFAKEVRRKYVSPPETTNFAVIFLPTESLYSEVVRDAVFLDDLRKENVIITGPSTLSAMLSSMQVGFKTLQIQKGAAEIERMLGAVKKEFENFETVLTKARDKVRQAGNDLDALAGTRTRAINRSLRDVQIYTGESAQAILGIEEPLD